jgi:predicted amidohydrolase
MKYRENFQSIKSSVIYVSLVLIFFLHLFFVVKAQTSVQQEVLNFSGLPKLKIVDHRGQQEKKSFPRFGQCQIKFELKLRSDQTNAATQPNELKQRLYDCFEVAQKEKVNVLILPELAFSFPEELRREIIIEAKKITEQNKMIIIAGSYYDESRYNRLLVIGDKWTETGYKIRPSRFEVSPINGEGMMPGESVLILKTVYGTLAIITCVDLISDDVQYLIRRLATQNDIDVLININYNPAAWEFLIEANSIVRRHPIFASITNVANPSSKQLCSDNTQMDNGYCYGSSAIFANLRTNPSDAPNNADFISEALPPFFTEPANRKRRLLPYDNLVATVTPFREAMLIYDLNINLTREPLTTNAPDQGYPTIKNIKIVDLKSRVP